MSMKAARVNKNLSQEEAAKKIGVTVQTLRNWEHFRSYPSVEVLPSILNVYDCKYDDIIFLPSDYALSVRR